MKSPPTNDEPERPALTMTTRVPGARGGGVGLPPPPAGCSAGCGGRGWCAGWPDEEAGAHAAAASVLCSAVAFVEDAGNGTAGGGWWCRGGARACACAASALAAASRSKAYSIGNTIGALGSPIVKPSRLSTTGAVASRGASLCAVRDNHVPIEIMQKSAARAAAATELRALMSVGRQSSKARAVTAPIDCTAAEVRKRGGETSS